jgi:hypothetical protein
MARSARTVRKTAGIPAGAWFASQSFHSSIALVPAPAARVAAPAPRVADLFDAETSADTRFYAGLLVEALETRAALEAEAEDDALIAARDLERELDWRADREGDACGRACGFCGRCS